MLAKAAFQMNGRRCCSQPPTPPVQPAGPPLVVDGGVFFPLSLPG